MNRAVCCLVIFLLIAWVFIPVLGHTQEDWSQKGIRYLKAERFDEAHRAFSNAIAEGYNNRGVAWQYRGDLDRAIEDYNKALEIFPDYFQAHNNRGVALVKKGEYKQAMVDFNRALELSPGYAKAYYNRGYVWHQQGNLDRAIDDYTKALEVRPGYAQAYNARGFAWDKKGDFDKAIADYSKAVEKDPRSADAYNKRGAVWAKKENYDEAIADYTIAIRIDPDYAEAYYNRAMAWHHKGNCERAIADSTEALDIDPNYAEAYNQLAWTLTVCEDDTYRDGIKAIKAAEKAVELKPEVNHLDTLAAAYAEAGKFEKATATQEKAIAMATQERKTEQMAGFADRLKSYRAHRSWRNMLAEEEYDICAAQISGADTPADAKEEHITAEKPKPISLTGAAVAPGSQVKVYSVQIGAFSSSQNAARLTARLKEKGYEARSIPMTYSGRRVLHTVLVGKYATLEMAKKAAADFSEKEKMTSSVRSFYVP